MTDFLGYLVDKLGNYKPVVILSLVLNLIFHHSLLFIPHQEMPGMMPAAYVVRHPATGKVEVNLKRVRGTSLRKFHSLTISGLVESMPK